MIRFSLIILHFINNIQMFNNNNSLKTSSPLRMIKQINLQAFSQVKSSQNDQEQIILQQVNSLQMQDQRLRNMLHNSNIKKTSKVSIILRIFMLFLILLIFLVYLNFKWFKVQTKSISTLNNSSKIGENKKTLEKNETSLISKNNQNSKVEHQQQNILEVNHNSQFPKINTSNQAINNIQIKNQNQSSILSQLQNHIKVVQINYAPGPYAILPLNTRQLNHQNKTIEEILYPESDLRKKRIQFEKVRRSIIRNPDKQFFHIKDVFAHLKLIEYNNLLDEAQYAKGVQVNQKQLFRLEDKFNLSSIKTELNMCIIAAGYKNNERFRIEHNLNSIFMQNYTNYKVVVIDDNSPDKSIEMYKKYFEFYRIDKEKYILLSTDKTFTALPNLYFSTMNHCKQSEIILFVDADDELIGRNNLKLYNWAFQTKKLGVLYSNYINYNQQTKVFMKGHTQQYTQAQKVNNIYREVKQKLSHLRSFRLQLFRAIQIQSFTDRNGNMFDIDYDQAIFIPLLQLSCGRVFKIEGQYSYLYNSGTGSNDYLLRAKSQIETKKYIRSLKRNKCLKAFDERMKKQ